MVLFNYSTKEITAKIVYYGPGLCGKTTNLQFIYDNLPGTINKGKMLSLATKTDRTLFFDFLPIDLGTIRGMRTRLQLYTVPGQVFYNTTRKLVLKGADGIVFVADSQRRMMDANIESFTNLEENLAEHDMNFAQMPHIIQFNKRDLPDVATIEELNVSLNKHNAPIYEGVATTGIGVHETLKAITRLVLNSLKEKYADKREQRAGPPAAVVAAAMAAGRAQAGPAAPSTPAAAPRAAQPAPAITATVEIQKPPIAIPLAAQPDLDLPEMPEIGGPGDSRSAPLFEDVAAQPAPVIPADLFNEPAAAEPLAAPPAAAPAAPLFEMADEPVLEVLDDLDLGPESVGADLLELADAGAPEASPLAGLEQFEEAGPQAPAPIDATAEVFLAGLPAVPAGAYPDDTLPPMPASAGAASETKTDPQSVVAPAGTAAAAPASFDAEPAAPALLSEEAHDPLDLMSMLPQPGSDGNTTASTSLFEEDRANLPFEGESLAPILVAPLAPDGSVAPAGAAGAPRAMVARGVSEIAALPLSGQEINLPINLEIGGQSIRFQLRISLDLSGSPTLIAAQQGDGQGARS